MKRHHWVLVAVLVVATLVAERFVHHEHDYWFHHIPGFFVAYGFVGCVAIVYLSKWYGKYAAQRDQDYYLRFGDEDEHRATTSTTDEGPERSLDVSRGDNGRGDRQ